MCEVLFAYYDLLSLNFLLDNENDHKQGSGQELTFPR